jgi:NitT/TauT family transport system substrate-binding protein
MVLHANRATNRRHGVLAVFAALLVFAALPASAESVKIGVLKTTGSGPAYIAHDKGYFAAEGLTSELVFFESAQPISVALASDAIDIGYTGLTGGFYGLASQGVLRVVGGGAHETPGFPYQPFLVSNKAYEAGLKSFRDFPGHSFGVSQIGSPPHYALGLLAEKYGFDIKSMRIQPLQSIPNMASAISAGSVDTTMVPGNVGVALLERAAAKRLGYAGDETPYQLVGVMVSTKEANERQDFLKRALRAIRKGTEDYHAAFTGPDGKPREGKEAPALYALMAKYAGQSVEDVKRSIPYIDGENRLDVADVLRQLAWYKSQGLVKGAVGGDAIIDQRYAVAMPTH